MDARVVVVGASSGLGRALGVGLAGLGSRVAFLARRIERIEDAALEVESDAFAVACDVREEAMCREAIADAAARLGGIDALIYCAGIGPLARLRDTNAAIWREVLDTNVVGAALVTSAALEHLERTSGRCIYLSSMSASLTQPWFALGAYSTSKAALERLIDAWALEHPTVGFTRLVVGNTAGGEGPSATEFANGWDPELAKEAFAKWANLGYLDGSLIETDDLVEVVAGLLNSAARVRSIVLA